MSKEDELEQFTAKTVTIVEDIFQRLGEERELHGEEAFLSLSLSTLSSMICTLVYRSLEVPTQSTEGLDGDERFVRTHESYAVMKERVQHAIGVGFSEAMNNWKRGQETHFSCEIYPVPEETAHYRN